MDVKGETRSLKKTPNIKTKNAEPASQIGICFLFTGTFCEVTTLGGGETLPPGGDSFSASREGNHGHTNTRKNCSLTGRMINRRRKEVRGDAKQAEH